MENFKYSVSIKKKVSNEDKKNLLKLYQPILGPQVTSIYLTLLEEKEVLEKLNNLNFNEKRLMKLLKLTKTKLMDGIHKLEGIKLIKSRYQKVKKVMNFQIQSPLEPNDFFANIVLNEMLKNSLGEEDYEILRYWYLEEEIIDEELEDLSVSFLEAFPEETSEITLKNLHMNEVVLNEKRIVKDELINFDNLELELIKNDLPVFALTKNIKKLLIENVSFFGLDQKRILELLIEVYNYEEKIFDYQLLKLHLKNEIQKQSETIKLSKVDKMKVEFKQIDPEEYIESLTGAKPTLNLKNLVDQLKNKYHLAIENINCLLNYSTLKNSGRIIERYILKIAETLNKKQICELDDVMEHLKAAHLYTTNKLVEEAKNEIELKSMQPEPIDLDLPEPNQYFII